jgi:hypothetical protein
MTAARLCYLRRDCCRRCKLNAVLSWSHLPALETDVELSHMACDHIFTYMQDRVVPVVLLQLT